MAGIPPVCGGYRSNVSGLYGWNVYSPRVRGLSVVLSTVTRWLEVFPPCAGVIGGVVHGYPQAGSIPPVCGGYRSCCPRLPAGWKYSPRMRGLSEVFDLIQKGTDVFPPHAGVIGHPHGYLLHSVSIPPACGGYRLREAKTPPRQGYSPRVRGLSVTFWQLVKHFCVFPPHAGVIGENGNLHKNVFCIPPVCGGYRPRLSKAK